jgi:hypothetical protein
MATNTERPPSPFETRAISAFRRVYDALLRVRANQTSNGGFSPSGNGSSNALSVTETRP